MSRQVELIVQKETLPSVSSQKATKGTKPGHKDTKKTAAPAKGAKTPSGTYKQKQDDPPA